MALKVFKDDDTACSWGSKLVEADTQCKHGAGTCALCGTRDGTDIVHRRRAPDKKTARRLRRTAKRKASK